MKEIKKSKKKRKLKIDLIELGPDVDKTTCETLGGKIIDGKCFIIRERKLGRPSKIDSHIKIKR